MAAPSSDDSPEPRKEKRNIPLSWAMLMLVGSGGLFGGTATALNHIAPPQLSAECAKASEVEDLRKEHLELVKTVSSHSEQLGRIDERIRRLDETAARIEKAAEKLDDALRIPRRTR